MRRGQATILLVAVLLPASGLAMLGLALLGARVQGERAQRLADGVALAAALGRPTPPLHDGVVAVTAVGGAQRATVTLAPSRFGSTVFAATATAVARPVVTADGRRGAVLVG